MEQSGILNADKLISVVRDQFEEIIDGRVGKVEISLTDALLSGFALFSLKDPSLLAFDQRRKEPENLQRIYHLKQIPSDTQMRTILDEVAPDELRPVYKALWGEVCTVYTHLDINITEFATFLSKNAFLDTSMARTHR